MTAAILLLALGLLLIIAEVFFPSFGLLSVLATAALVGSIVMAFQESTAIGFRFLLATAVLVPAAILTGFKLFPKTPLGKRMVGGGLAFGDQVHLAFENGINPRWGIAVLTDALMRLIGPDGGP